MFYSAANTFDIAPYFNWVGKVSETILEMKSLPMKLIVPTLKIFGNSLCSPFFNM